MQQSMKIETESHTLHNLYVFFLCDLVVLMYFLYLILFIILYFCFDLSSINSLFYQKPKKYLGKIVCINWGNTICINWFFFIKYNFAILIDLLLICKIIAFSGSKFVSRDDEIHLHYEVFDVQFQMIWLFFVWVKLLIRLQMMPFCN